MKKQLLTKTLLMAVMLLGGANFAWADEIAIDNVDFENESTFTTGWTFPNGNITTYHNLYDTSDAESGHYIELINNRNGANRTGYFTFSDSRLTSADKWRLEFDFGLASESASTGNSQNMRITCASGDILTIRNSCNSTSASVTSEKSPSSAICTLTVPIVSSNAINRYSAVPAFHFVIECKSDGVYATITSLDKKTSHLAETKIADATTLSKINFSTDKYYSNQSFDNIQTWVIVDDDVVSDPTIAVTGVNGAKRTITITGGSSVLGNDVTTYYTIDGTDPTSSSSTYSAPFEVSSACTVKAITISSEDVESNITSLVVTAGAVKLGTPTIKRTGASTYTISATTTKTDGFTADQTIHYIIGGGVEQTGTSLTGVDGNIVAWATATGFTTSDNAEMTYVKPYELASDATWSYNLNSYPSSHTCTNIADALSTTSKEIQSTTMYNLKEETYPNLFIQNGSGWLLRNQANNAWKCQSASQSIGFDNVTTTDVIYLYAAKDKGGNSISSVTNGTVRYSYSDNYYYIVPTTNGSVKVTFNTGVSLNTIAVYKQVVSGTITAAGWSTFASSYPLDLSTLTATHTPTAYYASAASGSKVTLTSTTATVPAGEGLMIKGTAGETFTIDVAASGTAIDGNLLVGLPNGGTVTANAGNYVFGWADAADPGFYFVNNTEPTLGAGKAYLHVAGGVGSRLNIVFGDDEVTGVKEVIEVNDNSFYDLNGRKVAQPQKGLYIVNGKKVVIK